MELKNYNPKNSDDWAIVAINDSVEFNDIEQCSIDKVEIDGQNEEVNELD